MLKSLKGWKLSDWKLERGREFGGLSYALSYWTLKSSKAYRIRIDEYVADNNSGAKQIVQSCLDSCTMVGVHGMLRPDIKADAAYGPDQPGDTWVLFSIGRTVTYIRNVSRDPISVTSVAEAVIATHRSATQAYKVSWRKRRGK